MDGHTEEERGRSEATIRFVVNGVKQLDGNPRYSAVTYIRHLPWRLRVMKGELTVTVGLDGAPGESTEFVRVFLCCNYKPNSTSWWCTASAEVTLIAQSDTGNNVTRSEIGHIFRSIKSEIVFDHLIAFNDLVIPEKGFIKDNTIVVEAKVSAGSAYDVIKPSNMGHIFSLIQWKSVEIYPQLDYFMNESKSDVVFKVEGKPIPALKEILCFQCEYFRSMFSGNYTESNVKEIEIKDTTHEAFKSIVWYLYSHELAVDSEELLIDLEFQYSV